MKKITSRRNIKCLHVKNLGKSKEYRNEHGEFLCDGNKMLAEAIKSKISIVSVFTTSKPDTSLPEETEVYLIDESIMDSLSTLKDSQDILFICKIPVFKKPDYKKGTHILLDKVQDPGNVGTIIRSAYAFGIDSVLLTEDCADPYSPKAVRASMGAVFRQKTVYINPDELSRNNYRIIGTANNKNKYKTLQNTVLKDSIIILGNEGQGISDKLSALCEEMITIPLSSDCESLNVAAAATIIMWESKKE